MLACSQILMRKREGNKIQTWLLRLAIGPLGDGKMDFLAREGFSLVRLFQAIPHQICAYVRVGNVGHSRRPPKRNSCVRRHLYISFFHSVTANSDANTKDNSRRSPQAIKRGVV